MTEVLYTMRNGKIVDPNIPMNGLVCYLDARGKTNNDIYKNVLLDLSGNGNHGTLQNFNFTEASGYSAGGLQFDGVDDSIIVPKFDIETPGVSIYMEYVDNFTISFRSPTQGNYEVGWIFTEGASAYIQVKVRGVETYIGSGFEGNAIDGFNRMLVSLFPDKIQTIINGKKVNYDIPGELILNYIERISSNGEGNNKFKKLMCWDRILEDNEITQLMEVE